MQNNSKERNNGEEFKIEKVLRIIDIVLKKFISNKDIAYSDFDDFKQIISEKYLTKQARIIENYSGNAKVATYLSAVVYRMVLEVIRSESGYEKRRTWFEEKTGFLSRDSEINPEHKEVISSEIAFFKRVLKTFGSEMPKVSLFVKYYYGLAINTQDIVAYTGESDNIYELENSGELKDKEIFANLCHLHNTYEQKQIKADAVRMYVNKQINSLIERMNGYRNRAFYDKESIGLLIEMAYQENLDNRKTKQLYSLIF